MKFYGSLQNRLMEAMQGQPKPAVGMGATICFYSDRKAATIIEVAANGKNIKVQEDIARRTDRMGMSDSQRYEYERNEQGCIYEAKLTKTGWKVVRTDYEGRKTTKNSLGVLVGKREAYHDFNF